MDTILSTTSFFRNIKHQFLGLFKNKKSALKASEILYLNGNSGIINLSKLSLRKATSGSVKTIEEFDLAGCFDKSEIIAAKVNRTKVLWSYHGNPSKEESWYDRGEKENKHCSSKNNDEHIRQINQERGN